MCKIWPLAAAGLFRSFICGAMDRGETHSGVLVYTQKYTFKWAAVTKVVAKKKW